MIEKEVYDSIPKLREIARLSPDEDVCKVALKFLERWDKVIEPSLENMKHDKRERKLISLYRVEIIPVLQKYEEITKT